MDMASSSSLMEMSMKANGQCSSNMGEAYRFQRIIPTSDGGRKD
jgi:hypothetical protein